MIKGILSLIINVLIVLVLVHAVGSWIPQIRESEFYRRLDSFFEPILRPIRNTVPSYAGLDFSPLILLMILYLIKHFFKL